MHDEVAELLVAGERRRLGGDALLQVAVRRDDVDEVIERRFAGRGIRIEQTPLVAGGVGEADGGREALAERAGGDLDTVGVAELGVAGGQRPPGAQRLQVVELEPEAAEVQLHVLRQRRVAGREDEPVAAGPVHIGRIVAHDALVQQVGGGSEAHRRARVTVADLLHGVCRQDAGGVHRAPIDFIPTQFRHPVAFLEVAPRRRRSAALVRMEKGEVGAGRAWFQHTQAACRPGYEGRCVTEPPARRPAIRFGVASSR